MHEVQGAIGSPAKSCDRSGVWRDLRFNKYNIKSFHGCWDTDNNHTLAWLYTS